MKLLHTKHIINSLFYFTISSKEFRQVYVNSIHFFPGHKLGWKSYCLEDHSENFVGGIRTEIITVIY